VLTSVEDRGRRPDFEGQPPADRKLAGSGRARRRQLAAGHGARGWLQGGGGLGRAGARGSLYRGAAGRGRAGHGRDGRPRRLGLWPVAGWALCGPAGWAGTEGGWAGVNTKIW
jgi:hypothetical protein